MTAPTDQTIRYGDAETVERPLGRPIMRGLLNRCPACGSGKLFGKFLKPVDNPPPSKAHDSAPARKLRDAAGGSAVP